MIRKLNHSLKNNRGNGYPLAVAITLILVMIFTGISEYFRLMIVAQGVRDALQDAVISTVVENYDEVYHGVREGYSGGYQPSTEDFEESIDYGDIYDKIDNILGLSVENDYHVKGVSDTTEMQFRIWNLNVDIENAPLATADRDGERFKIDSTIMLEVPVSFGGKLLPPMQIKVKNSAGYTPKF
ncbi:hypothetical protein PBV87_07890 [Niameybacter massiliensis]|uniref:Uncharacterized protein n=1 Tax=Holtiella tumoricola TaxID=3018743 RepID=A0AA42DLZ2_9FIRM|nr:hypothetical protein [Holtiella tumoricola]MDA3731395.1 hypothetical protein [Holtiella tumoricola]